MIRWLFIDIDNTICNSSLAYQRAFAGCYRTFHRTYPLVPERRFAQAYERARARIHRRLRGTAAMHDRALYFEELLHDLSLPFSAAVLKRLTATYWQQTYRNLRLYRGVRATLRTVRREGIRIGVVSDLLEAVQVQKLKRLGVDVYIDFLITSEAVGHEKPSPAIFRAALERAGCRPSEAVMVGDSAKRDILGARRLGLKTVLIGLSRHSRASASLRSFTQLTPRLLQRLSGTHL